MMIKVFIIWKMNKLNPQFCQPNSLKQSRMIIQPLIGLNAPGGTTSSHKRTTNLQAKHRQNKHHI
jgi:hypothetical protein